MELAAAGSPAGRGPLDRPIGPEERTGVLHPGNLERYGARWFAPSPDVRDVVDRYWWVRWQLGSGEVVDQRVVDIPAITLTVEAGNVPAPLVATGVQSAAWSRRLTGHGEVFGIRLRPAGLAVVGDVGPADLADATVACTPALDRRLHALLREVSAGDTPEDRARRADAAVRGLLTARPVNATGLLANAVLDALLAGVRNRTGALPAELRVSERTVQRALRSTLGRGPKWVSRRVRLQEVALALATRRELDLAALAAELGYADQAHLVTDFRRVCGTTPGAYRREVARLAGPPGREQAAEDHDPRPEPDRTGEVAGCPADGPDASGRGGSRACTAGPT